MADARFDETLTVRRGNLVVLGLALLPIAVGGVCGTVGMFRGPSELPLIGLGLAGLGVVALQAPFVRSAFASVQPQRVRVEDNTLHLGDERLPCRRITRAIYVPAHADGPDLVRITPQGRLALEVLTRGRSEAEALLAAMGFAVEQRVVTFHAAASLLPLRVKAALWGGLLLLGLAMTWALPALGLLPLVAAATLLGAQAVPTAVDIGADGVLLRWCGRRRFLPAASLAYTERFTSGFGRHLRHGLRVYVSEQEPVELLCGEGARGVEGVVAIEARLHAMQALPRREGLQPERASLAREGRPVDAWVRDLRAMGSGAASNFRHAAPSPERVLAVLEATDVPAVERAAAAVALSSAPDVPRERVRVVLDAVADPRLRGVIDAAVAGDEAALTRAITALDGERAKA